MEFEQVIQDRYSARNFKNREVAKETLLKLLEQAHLAPSAVNYQPWHFVVVTERKKLEELFMAYNRPWFRTAPVVIAACTDRKSSWKRPSDQKDFGDVDVAIAVDHLTLAATNMGLGTCWVCNFDPAIVRNALQLPAHIDPLALVPVGYPLGEIAEKKRKITDSIVSWETYYPYM